MFTWIQEKIHFKFNNGKNKTVGRLGCTSVCIYIYTHIYIYIERERERERERED